MAPIIFYTSEEYNFISDIQDYSDDFISRIVFYFKNGCSISVVSGIGTYGVKEGLFEIQICDIGDIGDFDGFLLDEPYFGSDGILGHCDAETVKYYIKKIGNM